MLDTVELNKKEAEALIAECGDSPSDSLMEGAEQIGGKKILLKHKVKAGYVIRLISPEQKFNCFYDRDNEPELTEVIEAITSHETDPLQQELELYRWGVKQPVPAIPGETFGQFKILLRNPDGWLEWLQVSGRRFFDTIEDSKLAVMLHKRADQDFVII
ncbi:MAG: hypothetical protein GW898_10550 [Thiomicrospira sp.]|nr:hypothetical protein [Thiomicrospira sp.]NCN66342.1 hypothetical protein [Thiomicrospira sp.]NCO14796.1 hypothetical protein [Thiomicrospira sp.]NCO82392.1 hypothetical protein [Thiomicrospira sp.]OIP95479.1 MAG: hypothetical protein AUK56_05410 [Thiomicrospira sp. CG2_30_44_34]